MESNRINFLEFKHRMEVFDVFSTMDVAKNYPHFDTRRLFEWQQKGYVEKLASRWYRFIDKPLDEAMSWFIANRIYQPSYISLETALSHYGLIPEGVFTVTSITTNKTRGIQTPSGFYQYRNIKTTLFFGYAVMRKNDRPILFADLEKALLDYLYFYPKLSEIEAFMALRLNVDVLISKMDEGKMNTYLAMFNSRALEFRVKRFKQFLHA